MKTTYQKIVEKADRCVRTARLAGNSEFKKLWKSIADRLYEKANALTIEEAEKLCD